MSETYGFSDGKFSFWTAQYGSWARDRRIVFRVREDNTPLRRAVEKEIANYDRIIPATEAEIDAWEDAHPTFIRREENLQLDRMAHEQGVARIGWTVADVLANQQWRVT